MITVKIVYVDPNGEVRMSPTGWPTLPVKILTDRHSTYVRDLNKAKEESIPFEDRQSILNLINSYHEAPAGYSPKKGNVYTIEPIQVELKYFFTIEITVEGIPNMKGITQTEYQRLKETLSESQFKRDVKVVARIVTEEEKPASEASAAFPQFQKCSSLQETHTTATDHTVCQPAPVVDNKLLKKWSLAKWGNEEVLMRDGVMVAITWQEIVDELNKLHQQPTEWIPVSEKQTISVPMSLIPKGAKLLEAYETERSVIVMFGPGEEVPELHNCDEMGCGSFSHVKYRLSLP